MKKLLRILAVVVITALLITAPVLAASSATITVTNTGAAYTTPLAITALMNNSALATGGFITPSGLDVLVSSSSAVPHMLVSDRTMFASPIAASSTIPFYYTTGNSPILNTYIIPGYNGFISVAYAAALEPLGAFSAVFSGYIDTVTSGATRNLIAKNGSFHTYVSAAGTVTTEINYGYNAPIYGSTSDGYTTKSDAVYNTAWVAAAADSVNTAATTVTVGQSWVAGPTYTIWRTYAYLPTATIPDAAVITSATLYEWCTADTSTTDFNITIQTDQPVYVHPADPPVVGDYDKSFYDSDGGSLTTAGIAVGAYNAIPLNATGLGWINKTGTTKLCLRSSLDIAGTAPTGFEYIQLASADTAGTVNDPYLVVTYAGSASVSVACSSAPHIITTGLTAAAGGTLSIQVDAGAPVTSAGVGATTDWGTDWVIDQANVMPYMDYFTYTATGAERIHYHLASIVSGTALPNNDSGGAYPGTFVFSANPTGVTTSLGALLSVPPSVSGTTAVSPSLIPKVNPQAKVTAGNPGITFPFYGMLESLLDDYNTLRPGMAAIPMAYVWRLIASLLAFMFGTIVLITTRQPLFGLLGYAIGFLAPALWMGGIFDWWVPVIYIVGAVALTMLVSKWTSSSIG